MGFLGLFHNNLRLITNNTNSEVWTVHLTDMAHFAGIQVSYRWKKESSVVYLIRLLQDIMRTYRDTNVTSLAKSRIDDDFPCFLCHMVFLFDRLFLSEI